MMKSFVKVILITVISLALLTSMTCFTVWAEESDTVAESETSVSTVGGADDPASVDTATETESEFVTDTETESETDTAANFDFAPGNFVINLKYMAAGMVGIFLVIGAIILTIVLLGKLTAPKKKREEDQ